MIFILIAMNCMIESHSNESLESNHCLASDDGFCPEVDYGPHSPSIPCIYLPLDFLECEEPYDHKGNETARRLMGYGCSKFGGQKYEDMQFTARNCTVMEGIQCYGSQNFMKPGFPCVRYSGHYFVTTLLYSLLLGFLGMDRFCLGHTGTAVGKLLTLGGVGIWWIVDIVLLVTGHLMPEDGSQWMPNA